MKQIFIHKRNSSSLTLFFAGWGMDARPFLSVSPDNDLMVCYDYRSLSFDADCLHSYSQIKVVAWSMGVWAATHALSDTNLPLMQKIAINGTPFPIDNQKGIVEEIAHGTLHRLNEKNLQKFYRRMCATAADYSDFIAYAPRRGIDEIKEELSFIIKSNRANPKKGLLWNKAYIGVNDLIFLPPNQKNGWREENVEVCEKPIAHFDQSFLFKILSETE